MVDPAASELVPPPSSPTNSSISSSDLDTESTGSFFHDRSTTLGTLMGVTFPVPPIAFRPPSHSPSPIIVADRRRRWWRFCSHGQPTRSSLGQFLEVERRYGTALFADGRVLPPAVIDDGASTPESLCSRFPVSLTGICSGGAGFG
ncbi:uncharacterized protein At3g17950 [Lotus japonicus]|uniref:uncharacterized protein At3g17950 n=1 Tax=Lotus japonicus TaxID=34305 RepID=UPI0025906184|nr:uncharacterized protein At3g17950 [Lotus japonicus]